MAKTRIKAPSGARSRTVGDVLGALLAGLLLAALLTGIPYGLVRFVGWPLPTSMPTLDMLQQSIGVGVFIDVLACFVWVLWAQFLFCVVVEFRSAVSGIDITVPLPVAGASQALARKLVTTMLLVGAGALTVGQAASASAVPAQGPVQRVAAVAAVTSGAATQTSTTTAVQSNSAASGPVYTVQASHGSHHETLWDIAQRYLGDGRRFSEIFDLNKGRIQPDGTRMTEPGLVRAGWQLQMPADAKGVPGATAAPSGTSAQHTVTVEKGDTLSEIAQEQLGSADQFPVLLDATKDVVQPDGRHLTDPDKLFPGDIIVIPGPTAAAPPAAQPVPSTPAPAPAPATPTPPPDAATPSAAPSAPAQTPVPEASAPVAEQPAVSAPASTAPEQNTPVGQAPAADTPAAHTSTGDESPVSAQQAVGGIAALLGAALLGVIAWRRREQQNARRPGETIAMPEETSQVEQILDRTSSPASVEFLDRALRTLAHEHPDALPSVRGARVTSDSVEILVDDPDAEALSPFTDRPGGWWGVRAERATLLSEDQAREVSAPYPGLSTIGSAEDGTHVLANLPHLGVLLLDGDEQQVREVARGIAMEAGTSAWADHIEVLTAGFGLEMQQLLPACRVMFTPGLETATADLARVLIEAHQAEKEGGEEPLPWMVVCATSPSPEELYKFADLMGKARGHRIAAVLPAAGARDIFPDAEVLDASLVTEAQPLEVLNAEVVLQRVPDEAYRQLTATMTTAVQPAVPAKGAWANVPDPDRPRFGPSTLPSTNPASRAHLSLLVASPDADDTAATAPVSAGGVQQNPPAKPVDAKTPDTVGAAAKPTDAGTEAPVDQDAETPASATAADAIADPRLVIAAGRPPRKKEQPRVSIVREGEPAPAAEKAAPQVQVLGPLRITGLGDTTVAPKLVLLAALLIFKNDRDYGSIANHMNPAKPWATGTMDQEMSRLRARLGVDSNKEPYLRPKPRGVQQYSLSEEVTCDWADFLHLSERGLPHGAAGVRDLEAALRLVRGRPFGGAGTHSWAAPIAQTMISRIVDTAHTIAFLRCGDEVLDVDAARDAVKRGLDVEPTAEILFRDWMRIEHRAGNVIALRDVVAQTRQMATDWELGGLQDETENLILKLTTGRGAIKGL